jgi:hypothetical protein
MNDREILNLANLIDNSLLHKPYFCEDEVRRTALNCAKTQAFYSSQNTVCLMESKRLRWAGHVEDMTDQENKSIR